MKTPSHIYPKDLTSVENDSASVPDPKACLPILAYCAGQYAVLTWSGLHGAWCNPNGEPTRGAIHRWAYLH